MGLDTTHDCYSGTYSGFAKWRSRLAKLAGLNENKLDDRITQDTVQGIWDFEPADVLDVLLLHSDCEYIIPARFCAPLADRLEGLLAADNDEWTAERTKRFITGLRDAAVAGEDVEFG
jgi:hypothetical protein